MKEYAVLKGDVIEVCQYDGFEELDVYPKWMHQAVINKSIESLFEDGKLDDIDPRPDDWFLCNKKCQVKQIDYDTFKENYLLVDGDSSLACLKQDVIECVIFDGAGYGDWDSYPKWIQSLIDGDGYYINDQLMLMGQPVCPGDVFLRNRAGYVRLMFGNDFNDIYYIAA